ncbi:MAG TPA: hypothetical protein VKP78_00495 [bacterium]|nr:hypothetical protein [bacterium]
MRKILSIILALIFVYNCHNSTGPEKKDPRELFWSVDTLLYPECPQTMMEDIWGSSANNVYAVGHSSRNTLGTMYHYNGEEWQPVPLSFHAGGPLKGIYRIQDIYGFSSNNVYAVGEGSEWESKILHYDGKSWKEIDIPRRGSLFCIYGDAPDNIWAAGNMGTIFHYDGEEWQTDSLPHTINHEYEVSIAGKSMAGDSVHGYYLATYSVKNGIMYDHLFYNNGDSWVLKDSCQEFTSDGIIELWMSPSGTLYKTNWTGIYKYEGDEWKPMRDDVAASGIYGTSDDNIFITAADMETHFVLHYNGIDWYKYDDIFQSQDVPYLDVFTIEGEVFVVGYTTDGFPNKTVIWHGK